MVDYGLTHVVFDNMRKTVSKNKSIKTHSQIDELVETLKKMLDEEKYNLHKILDSFSTCDHDYDDGQHYDRKMVMGNTVRHFERTCKTCGCIDSCNNDNVPALALPPWTAKTKQRYYNDSI